MQRSQISTNALLYEAILCFRNAVVGRLRHVLVNEFPTSWELELTKPFTAEEWKAIKSSVSRIEAGGAANIKHVDSFDYLSVNHFYNLFDRHFALLLPSSELPPAEYVKKFKKQILEYLAHIKEVRDPVSHPAEEEFSAGDAYRAVDSARRVLQKLHFEKESAPLDEIAKELIQRISNAATPDILSPVDDTLPPRETIVVDFVGRRDELTRLWEWLIDPHTQRWLLSGDGGKGKSALAYKFATDVRLAAPEPLCGVFWLSAKRRRYQEGEIVDITSPDFWDLDSALSKILSDYGWGEESTQSLEAKKMTALGLLEEFPCLLIVDDLDSIQPEAEQVVEFLTFEAPRSGSKILITSRRQFAGMGPSSTVVEGLAGEAAREFVESRQRLLAIPDAALSPKRVTDIVEACEGSPLYIEDLLRLCTVLPFESAMQAWKSHQGETVRRYALERELELLSKVAREIVQICSIADGAVSVLELEAISGQSQETILSAINELRRMYLVPAPELVEDVPRFQVNRNLRSLVRSSIQGTPLELKIRNGLRGVAGEEIARSHAGVIGDYARQARVLVERNRFDDAERTIKAGLEQFPEHPRLLSVLGWTYSRWWPQRRAVDARQAWERAYQMGSKERATFYYWATMEIREEQWQRAAEAAERGLERCGQDDPQFLQLGGFARSRLGQALQSGFNYGRANQELMLADTYLEKAIKSARRQRSFDSELISRSYRAWVLNAQWRQDPEAICRRLREWVEWNSSDPQAKDEAERQSGICPDALNMIRAVRAAG